MNITSFSEGSYNDLMHYLKVANDVKGNNFCDIKTYEKLRSIFPLPKQIKAEYKAYVQNLEEFIDITESDEDNNIDAMAKENLDSIQIQHDEKFDHLLKQHQQSNSEAQIHYTNHDDVIYSIKDSLIIQNGISSQMVKELSKLDNADLEKIFLSLTKQLSLEDVVFLWNSINENSDVNEYIIFCYIRYILLDKDIQCTVLKAFRLISGSKYSNILKNELVRELLNINSKDEDNEIKVIQQYIGSLDSDLQIGILELFVSNCEKLDLSHITTMEALLNPQCNYDVLRKLVELMSNNATEFSNNNSFGKLLYNVVNLLGKNISHLERPLKHILGIHRSIWKVKVQKVVASSFDESLTQSFF